ncbi:MULTISPECIES: hypothetical protein [Bacillaceae]|uniref:hypothetical protein n=1 Tax=Bacillaceae TaxID=186817 RepID=UPI000BFBBC21|nr:MULTISPECIES: hypothetical protein [Bacillaceae]PGT82426.1 hypothetical protein COD11_14700 [Bacillus sp. AFS040349]UGB31329.1 hypothetical protein LPC09_02005 [Metabacillus sp. B2-18]
MNEQQAEEKLQEAQEALMRGSALFTRVKDSYCLSTLTANFYSILKGFHIFGSLLKFIYSVLPSAGIG